MKKLVQPIIGVLLFGLVVLPAQADFSSLYVFGDGLSTTANNPSAGSLYYGQRFSNGRVWVEVLAQRQGLVYDPTKNNSYFDHNSAALVSDINKFQPPPDVANDLFVVWVCNADTFDATTVPDNAAQWQAAIKQSQANHLQIITQLYVKGVRTLLMPNAVDISEIPAFNAGTTLTGIEHTECVAYNAAFSNTITQALSLCPGLTIYAPDYFTLLNNVLTNAAAYGLVNALSPKGFSIDALDDPKIFKTVAMNGPGTNYIFWDNADPTAKFHEVIADVTQQIISPVQIDWLALFNGSNRLDVVNVPVGLNGFVDGSTNLSLANWMTLQNIISTNTEQSVFVNAPPLPAAVLAGNGGDGSIDPNDTNNQNVVYIPPINPAQYYRLEFPYTWSWP